MAEAVAVVGLVAAISQFVEYGLKLVERLDDFSTGASDRPNAFAALKVRLPAVIAVVSRVKKQIENQMVEVLEADTLLPLIANTNAHIRLLLNIIEKSVPPKKSSLFSKYVKAMRSLSLDSEVQKLST